MAKNSIKQRKNEGKVLKITTPSRFGSHSVMMVDPQPKSLNRGEVLLKDELGEYITLKNRLDNGLADPNRYAQSRLVGKLEIGDSENVESE